MKRSLLAFSFIGILMAAAISIAGQQPITAKDKRSADEVMAIVAKWADADAKYLLEFEPNVIHCETFAF